VSPAGAGDLGSGRAYDAARLRWAAAADAEPLAGLWRTGREADDVDAPLENAAGMRDWLEHGGAVLLENAQGQPQCAVRWRWGQDGWDVDRIATLPEARGLGFGRWLMTKLEALAIKRNVPTLRLTLRQPDLLPYYERLGYREESRDGDVATLAKRVGGTWQRQPGSAP